MPVNEQIKVSFIGDADPLEKSVTRATGALVKMQTATGRADQALLNLSRVAQDAPFGFLGIANNLNPLLESFQRLQKESGSTGGALKALVGSLSGAGGIGLALGVVSSLAVVFGDKLFGSKEATDNQKQSIDELNKSLSDSKERFEDLAKSIQHAQDIADINIKINDQSPVLGLQQRQIGISEKRFAATSDLNATQKAIDDLNGTIDKLELLKESVAKTPGIIRAYAASQGVASVSIEDIDKSIETYRKGLPILEKALGEHYKTLNGIENEQDTVNVQIRLQRKEDRDKINAEEKTRREKEQREADAAYKKALAAYKKYIEDEEKLRQTFITANKVAALNPDYSVVPPIRESTAGADFLSTGRELNDRANPNNLGVLPGRGELNASIDKQLADAKAKMAQFQKEMQGIASTISGTLAPAFQGMFDAIIAGQAPLQAFFQTLGNSVLQLINQLIAAAIQAAVLSLILPGGGGGFGKLFGKALGFGGVPHFAAGGIISGPTLGMIGEYSGAKNDPEVVAPLSRLKDIIGNTGGQVIVIGERRRGKDMILQATRAANSKRRTG